LLAAFKEPNPNKEIPTVDLTRDDGLTRDDRQPATALAVFTREPARASGFVIRKPVRRPTRVVVPTVEKGLDAQILIFILLASARIVLQYSVLQVRGRSHKELCCEN
jgi:hypothetical protein